MKSLLFITAFFIGIAFSNAQNPGNSLHFDGVNDYVSAPLPTVFSNINTNSITIETWIKPQSSVFSRVVFAQLNASNFISVSTGGSNQIYFYINNTVGVVTNTSLPLNQWTHVACTWNGTTQQTEVYFNGMLQTTASGGSSSTGNDNIMTIGSRTNGAQYFNGELDELRIWDVKRSVCDINSSMNSEFTQAQPNLVAYYNFNQGVAGGNNSAVTSLLDFTTNHNGTLNNFMLGGTTSNWVSSGAVINQVNQNNGTINSIDTRVECGSLLWIDGNTYSSNNNTATHTLVGGSVNGCDSIVTLNLTIINIDNSVTNNTPTLTANQSGASYRWLDCDNGNAVINGETSQSYTATVTGNYAVEITVGNCVDTSACENIIVVGIDEESTNFNVSIFPNPTKGLITINFNDGLNQETNYTVTSIEGKVITTQTNIVTNNVIIDLSNESKGVYFLKINSGNNNAVYKLIKQ